MNSSLNVITFLIVFLMTRCNYTPFELSQHDYSVNTRSIDNTVFKTGRKFRYEIQFFDSTGREKRIIMNDITLDSYEKYPIVDTTEYNDNEVLFFEIIAEQDNGGNVTNEYQTTIEYSFFNRAGKALPFMSRTGVVDNDKNIWLHPPRTGPFKVLNLQAYPSVKFPISENNVWDYEITIGKNWFHKEFARGWKGEKYMFKHSYKIKETQVLQIGNRSFKCTHISATTKSLVGNSHSDFYFSPDEGFIKMSFFNMNGSEFRFLKIID